ncbi:MAG TPA: DnaA/Hda family protein [Ktedonobacterales bacterium]|nr:DnaA/Hda family protein [Ktedonobacterales bacterium]
MGFDAAAGTGRTRSGRATQRQAAIPAQGPRADREAPRPAITATTAITPPSSLSPTSEAPCPLCQGLGWVRVAVPVGDSRFGQPQPCACLRAARQQHLATLAFQASNLTEPMRAWTFETFQPTALSRAVYARARAFAADPQGWLFLRGGYGVGKTHLLAAITNALLTSDSGGATGGAARPGDGEPGESAAPAAGTASGTAKGPGAFADQTDSQSLRRPGGLGHTAARRYPLYVVVPVWLDYIRAGFDVQGGVLSDSAIARKQQAIEADVLLLDDMGAESETAWTQEQLYQVLNARYNARTPTVIATNLLPQRLEPRIRSRLSDWRLVEECVLLGPDQRSVPR